MATEDGRERRQEQHSARLRWSREPVARQHLHEPIPEALRLSGRGEAFRAHIVNYADDFVILSRGVRKRRDVDKAVMMKLG